MTCAAPEIRAITEIALHGGRDTRVSFVRVHAGFTSDGRLHVRAAGAQGPHHLHAMALSNTLAVVGPGEVIEPGDEVNVMPLDRTS